MEQDHDFAALRNLLAIKRLEMPMDTEVNRFLIEFHRRQRAQLISPVSAWDRALTWLQARLEGFQLLPSLSYASAFAAVAIMACVGLSQQVQVTHTDGQYQLSLHMPTSDSSFAMLPTTFGVSPNVSQKKSTDSLSFSPTDSTTRFVLTNSHTAYDATVAF